MEGLANLGISLESIVIYVLNYGLLLAVLSYLLYDPIVKFTDKRRETIKGQLEEAEMIKKEFASQLETLKVEKLETEKKLQSELEAMRSFVEEKRKELISEMETERKSMLEKAAQEIAEAKEEMVSEVEVELQKKMSQIILEVISNKVPKEVIAESVTESWSEYKK
jgi:F-type H+-transporting ATPase subunit b